MRHIKKVIRKISHNVSVFIVYELQAIAMDAELIKIIDFTCLNGVCADAELRYVYDDAVYNSIVEIRKECEELEEEFDEDKVRDYLEAYIDKYVALFFTAESAEKYIELQKHNLYCPFIGPQEEAILKHIIHWLEKGGEKSLCFGSDFFYEKDVAHLLHQNNKFFFDRYQNAACYPHLLTFIHSQIKLSEKALKGLASYNVIHFLQKNFEGLKIHLD